MKTVIEFVEIKLSKHQSEQMLLLGPILVLIAEILPTNMRSGLLLPGAQLLIVQKNQAVVLVPRLVFSKELSLLTMIKMRCSTLMSFVIQEEIFIFG